ncbi:MAG: DUF5682 family protein, partial [Actinomycetota bacterium]
MAQHSSPDPHLLGIRHHGPGSARSVIRALEQLEPDIVLVELPADTADALDWVGRDGLDPPVALLGYVVDDPQRAAFAPLAGFSPEWSAVHWANTRGIAVRPIDLPLSTTLALSDDGPLHRDPLGELAEVAGDPDPERWWEDVIEHRGDGAPAFEAVAEAMDAVRDDWTPPRREAMREAHMRSELRRAARDGYTTIAAVVGAWHVPALDPAATTVAADTHTLRGRPRAKVAVAWVPWSHERLATTSGYAAGVRSPGWYAHVFAHPGPDGVGRFFVQFAQMLRSEGLAASPDEVIAGTRLAEGLAGLRGRPRPGLPEVLDVADAVFTDGAFAQLDVVRRRLVVGERVGRVPDDAPQAPLARDLERRRRSTRLKMEASTRTVELDLRTPSGRRRSHLLHQLLALDVPWGHIEDGRGSSGTFRETWSIRWRPEFSIRLIECAGLGTTVADAAAAALVGRVRVATSLVDAVGVLDRALLADLPDAVGAALQSIDVRAAREPDVADLLDVLMPLATTLRYGDVRDTDRDALRRVFDDLVQRVIVALPDACRALDDEAARLMVERLTAVQGALAMLAHPLREQAFPEVLERLAEAGRSGLIHGRSTRLLHDAGRWDVGQAERRLSRALSPGTSAPDGAAFVEGFLAGSGTVLIHDNELRTVIDRWIAALPAAAFDDVV